MFNLGENQIVYASRKCDHGVYLTTEKEKAGKVKGEDVLLPKNEVPQDLEIGDEIEVFIYKDSSDRIIATRQTPYIKLHEVAILTVTSVGKIGAFLDWGLPKELLLPFKQQTKKVKEGDEVIVALYIDKSGRLALTMNVYEYLSCESPYQKDDHVKGRVYQISERFGAFVAVDNKYSALIPAREVMPDIRIGMDIEARVSSVREDGKLTLSPKEKAYVQMDKDAEHVMHIIEAFDGVLPFSDKASVETIKREMGMSKNAFKRAVGRLYKERRIIINDNSIRKIK